MTLKERFPNLYQFFGGYFPDSDFDNLTEEEVVREYVSDCSKEELSITLKEMDELIGEVNEFWKAVGSQANRYFENVDDALHWLKLIRKELYAT